MKLSELAVDRKSVWVDVDAVKGFSVEINYIPRTEMSRLVKDSQVSKFDKTSRSIQTQLDDEKFVKKYVERAINGWKGLTTENISELVPVKDTEKAEEIPFSVENAIFLVKESSYFDEWLNAKIGDIDSFR